MATALTTPELMLLAFGLFAGGTPILIGAMYFALSGSLDVKALFFLTIGTTLLWDSAWYTIGRLAPMGRLKKFRLIAARAEFFEKLSNFYLRHRYVLVFTSRFVYGTNSALSALSGISMKYIPFIATCILSICAWFITLYGISAGVKTQLLALENVLGAPGLLPLFFIATLGITLCAKKLFERLLFPR